MGASPSIHYHVNFQEGKAYAKNEMFPDQRVELTPDELDTIQMNFKFYDAEDEAERQLRKLYREKYLTE